MDEDARRRATRLAAFTTGLPEKMATRLPTSSPDRTPLGKFIGDSNREARILDTELR
jgi:hypothetical protein